MTRTTNLCEDISTQRGPLRVDRTAGVIYGAKLCGTVSKNGRRYPLKTLREANRLYDRRPCNVDHAIGEGRPALVESRLGIWRQPETRADGVYGNLHYLKSHPLAGVLCEAAERMPSILGFSHNADGDAVLQEGVYVVNCIREVRSVDLVADPATTGGLFEGCGVIPGFGAFIEALRRPAARPPRNDPAALADWILDRRPARVTAALGEWLTGT